MKRIKGSVANHVSKSTVSKQEKHVLQMGHTEPAKKVWLNIFSEVNLPSEILWTTSNILKAFNLGIEKKSIWKAWWAAIYKEFPII